ncbi:YihY family inner membrane protein [Cellvibrio sp. pealriver]|uniref:YihY family inner membrane protein n=1 Tax=Cellvibrio sp. pealriver TaxID=1622269 RepID=UPI00066FC696|nr:YihY family inner membrane protein [Cellvibrio sp. pealriver]
MPLLHVRLLSIHDHLRRYYRWLRGFFCLMVRQYQTKECQKSAASLTYVTLFATVPMMTVTYSMFSIIPAFQNLGDELQALLFQHFLPNSQQELGSYLTTFSEQARQLTLFGLLFLLVSAYLMLKNIEQNFNSIWGVSRGRRGVANFLLYWAILSLGPLLLGAALVMSTYLASLRLLMGTYDSTGVVEWVFQLAPWFLTWAAFTLLFVAVPNCKVSVRHALIGGLVTTLGFQGLKAIFGWIVGHSSFTSVYGAFAALPLFMLWVNLIWTMVLGGAVFVHTISAHQIDLRDRNYPDLLASLLVLWRCYSASINGTAVPERELLHQGLAAEQWLRIRDALVKHRVISANYQGHYLLSKNLDHLTIQQLADILGLPHQLPQERAHLAKLPWGTEAIELLGQVDTTKAAILNRKVSDLFSAAEDPGAANLHKIKI